MLVNHFHTRHFHQLFWKKRSVLFVRLHGKHSLDSLEWTRARTRTSRVLSSSLREVAAHLFLNELRHLERVRIGILDFFAWQFCAVSCKAKVLWCIWFWLSGRVVTILCYEEVVCQCMPYVLCSKQKIRQMGGAFEGFVLGPLFFIALLKMCRVAMKNLIWRFQFILFMRCKNTFISVRAKNSDN